MNTPFFTIIIPTYNRARVLPLAIKSVLTQTFIDFELIIVDDGSTDNTKEVVLSIKDYRIKYIYQENAERSAARNTGIVNAKGKYICFLDSDDEYLPNHLEILYDFISSKKRVVFAFTLKVGENFIKTQFTLKDVFVNTIHSQQVCILKSILVKEKYNEELNIGEDKELWMRISKKHKVFCINKQTVKINDYGDRSVDILRIKSTIANYKLLRFVGYKYRKHLSLRIRYSEYSNALYRIARSYSANNKRNLEIFYLLKSLAYYPFRQTKVKLYSIFYKSKKL